MKKLSCLLLLAFGFFTSAAAFAADAPSSMKIGILDAERILRTAPQIAVINKDLEKRFRPIHDKIMKEQQAVQAEIDKLNRDNATMTEKERSSLQDKILADRSNLRGEQDNFQQTINSAQDQAMAKFMETLKAAVNKVATEQHYDLVLLKQAAAYSTSKLDVTEPVLAILDKK
ncbi:MAG: OmpH family outer membrane protein [Gammaproteobacteria bacterium]|nr:OmpH family outer membrane protein [Gammaproteobacteria bacterium]